MKEHIKTMGFTLKRTIQASPAQVYKKWLDPKSPCNPASFDKKSVYKPKVGGLFCFKPKKAENDGVVIAHYGQFLTLSPGKKIQQTWMSRYTRGLESNVTVTFKKQGKDTLLTLHHANLPDDSFGKKHEWGWTHFLGQVEKIFAKK